MTLARNKVIWGELCPFGTAEYAFVPTVKAWRWITALRCDHEILYPTSAGHTATFDAKPIHGVRNRVSLVTLAAHVDKEPGPVVCGLLAHEATHVLQEFMGNIGEPNPSPEFEAYMMQVVAQDLIEAYCVTRRSLFVEGGKS